nr:hypothetical protein [Mycobacterium tilburgii]
MAQPGDVHRRDRRHLVDGACYRDSTWFSLLTVFWLWLTILFANLAEAVAEDRGKAQADTLRKSKADTIARRIIG